MKKFLENLIKNKEARADQLRDLIKAATTADEVRSLGDELNGVNGEIAEARAKLGELDEPEKRGFNPYAAIGFDMSQRSGQPADLEARSAFREYVVNGTASEHLERRDGAQVSADLGVAIPQHVMGLVLKELTGTHGKLYNKVRKTNLAGGVQYPVGAIDATFTRQAEGSSGTGGKGFTVGGSISFGYKLGEIKITQSIVAAHASLEIFEEEFAKIIAEAYMKAMDREIQIGNGSTEMQGILTVANAGENAWAGVTTPTSKIKVITLTAEEVADWTAWQTKVFAALPAAMRSKRVEMVTTYANWDGVFKAFRDNNDRPIVTEGWGADGEEYNRFRGLETTLLEPLAGGIADVAAGANVAMLWVPNGAYAINSNMEFSVRRYFDENTNSYVKKGLVINDGKILNPDCIVIVKQGA